MKDTFTLQEVKALFAAALQAARAQEREWDQNAARARYDSSADAYNREYIKGIAEGFGLGLGGMDAAFQAELRKLDTGGEGE